MVDMGVKRACGWTQGHGSAFYHQTRHYTHLHLLKDGDVIELGPKNGKLLFDESDGFIHGGNDKIWVVIYSKEALQQQRDSPGVFCDEY
jgi:hypothetical protein